MEDHDILCVDNDVDLLCLHSVYIPRINAQLCQFVSAWNCHPLRTENGLSPTQLWTRGLIHATDLDIVEDGYGIDDTRSCDRIDYEGVFVPE